VHSQLTWYLVPSAVLARKLASPPYVATTDLAPALVEVNAQLPLGADPVQVAPVPSLTLPVPLGVPLAGATAPTVKVTSYGWPTTDEVGVMSVMAVVEPPVTHM